MDPNQFQPINNQIPPQQSGPPTDKPNQFQPINNQIPPQQSGPPTDKPNQFQPINNQIPPQQPAPPTDKPGQFQPINNQIPPQQPTPVNESNQNKSHLAAILFSLFLSGLAVDRFYLGYLKSALVKLLLPIVGVIFIILSLVVGAEPIKEGTPLCIEYLEQNVLEINCQDALDFTGSFVFMFILGIVILVADFIWFVTDLIRICVKNLKPKNGQYV